MASVHGSQSQFVHVTVRTRRHVWNLRSSRCYHLIRTAFERSRGRFGARLIHFTVLGNHVHLILEADDERALARAMKGFQIRIAKALNGLMGQSGAVFDDHYPRRSCLRRRSS